jgi:hypothetical protein
MTAAPLEIGKNNRLQLVAQAVISFYFLPL